MKKLFPYVLVSLFIFAGVSTQVTCAQKVQVSATPVTLVTPVFSKIKNLGKNIRFSALAKLNMLSPELCFERAERMVSEIVPDDLMTKDSAIAEALIARLYRRFGADLLFVRICKELDRFLGDLKNMQVCLISMKQKIAAQVTKYAGLSEKCEALLKKITDLIVLFDEKKKTIVSTPEYKTQEALFITNKKNISRDFWANFIVRVGAVVAFYVFQYYYNFGSSRNSSTNNGPLSQDIAQCKKLFGVSADATLEQIKKAYRKEMSQWHPDRHSSDCSNRSSDACAKYREYAEALNRCKEVLVPQPKQQMRDED
ncbi:MAG: DnaJ domain-containing protein [bacterium]